MKEKINLFIHMYKTKEYYWIANIFKNGDLHHLNFFSDDMVTFNKTNVIKFKIKLGYHLSIRITNKNEIKDFLYWPPDPDYEKFKSYLKTLSKLNSHVSIFQE